jgi:hypothetical protein
MDEAKSIARGGHRLVLEDRPETCTSKSSGELYSDHGEELSRMDAPDGPSLLESRMTEEQAQA